MVLSQLKINSSGRVKSIKVDTKTLKILNNIGLCTGEKVTLIRKAPFGSPIEIKIRNFYLAIRKNLADKIELE